MWPDELILSFAFLCVATQLSGVRVDLTYVVFVPLVMVGGALIDFALQLAIATASFWVIRIDALRWVVMSLEQDFTRYPISIYSRSVRFVLSFVFPFAFMNYSRRRSYYTSPTARCTLSPGSVSSRHS